VNFAYINGVLRHTIANQYEVIRSRLSSAARAEATSCTSVFFLSARNVTWLAAHALYKVFHKKQKKYDVILQMAQGLMESSYDAPRDALFQRVVSSENTHVFADVRY
ncbi:hypothetical protein SARC_10653, partial [Sphaeroforma arctica JP610]